MQLWAVSIYICSQLRFQDVVPYQQSVVIVWPFDFWLLAAQGRLGGAGGHTGLDGSIKPSHMVKHIRPLLNLTSRSGVIDMGCGNCQLRRVVGGW